MTDEYLHHPDPQWWLRCPVIEEPRATYITKTTGVRMFDLNLDICEACGHVRYLHTDVGGCSSPSASMVGDDRHCVCVIKRTGSEHYRLPVAVAKARP